MKKLGRVRCGTCERVLLIPAGRPGGDVDASLAGVVKEWRGQWWRVVDIVADRYPKERVHADGEAITRDADGTATRWLGCRCGATYAVSDVALRRRIGAAQNRREDVVLSVSDRAHK